MGLGLGSPGARARSLQGGRFAPVRFQSPLAQGLTNSAKAPKSRFYREEKFHVPLATRTWILWDL